MIDIIDYTVISQRFLEDSIQDGDVTYHYESTDTLENKTVGEAIIHLRGLGVMFDPELANPLLATLPDGGHIIDYTTAEHEVFTVVLSQFNGDYFNAAVVAGVNYRGV